MVSVLMNLNNNIKWVSISQIVKVSTQMIGLFFFSHFLTPKQLGIMSILTIICAFVNIIRDMGFSAIIIQKEVITDSLKNSIFNFNLILGLFLFLTVYFSAGFLSDYFKEPLISTPLKIIALAFPINNITSIYLSILERDSKFLNIAKVECFSSFIALIVACIMAYNNAGFYSLITQTLLFSTLTGIGFIYFCRWVPSPYLCLKDIKSVFSFSANMVTFNFINYFSRNSDQIIIARNFGANILGQYSLAYKLMLFPIQNITYVLTRSLFPILSRLQSDNENSLKLYIKNLRLISFVVSPLMFGLASVSYEFVHTFLGNKWNLIPSLLLWLAPTAIIQAQISTTGAVFMSRGNTSLLVKITIVNAIVQVGAIYIGSFYDVGILVRYYFISNLLIY
ncbi:lipopolysaccharide biosynthesis protein, partial [Tatumella sp. OPLPL6]